MLRIIHLSDIHFSIKNQKDIDQFILPSLIKDLSKYHADKNIDLIMISGDLIDKGGSNSESGIDEAFSQFNELFITEIINNLGNINREQVFFSIGNHDIDRSADKEFTENGLKAELTNVDKVNKYIDTDEVEGIRRVIPFKKF